MDNSLRKCGSENDVRIMFRKSINVPGRPPSIVMCAATSFWLLISSKTVFDFLHDENTRTEWDILSNGGVIQRLVHIANGRETGNSVSILRVNISKYNLHFYFLFPYYDSWENWVVTN